MVINAPKSLSIAAALHPEVSTALDAAQTDAAAEIRRWLAQSSTTRVGPRGAQEIVPVKSLQTVAVTHKTSRAGDPHRHIHFQIGTRVQAAGKWRALDTGALFKQQGAIRALGSAVIAAHPQLADVLARHGLTLNPVTGEVVELQPFNQVMSKRARQVERNLDRLEQEWEQAHPGEAAGSVVQARLLHKAWTHERPSKKPSVLATEAGWRAELADAGYNPDSLENAAQSPSVRLDDLSIQEVASRALDRCAAGSSVWTPHQVREHVTRITTEYGVSASPVEVREFVHLVTELAVSDCFSVLPEHVARPDHVAHLTSIRVAEAETRLRDLLTTATPEHVTLQLRDGADPAVLFDRLQAMGLVQLHAYEDALREYIAATAAPGDAITAATNEGARELNARIQAARLRRGDLDHTCTITGSDGLDIGTGDVIQARKNDSGIGVANRQTFTVQHITDDGTVYAVENGNDRKHQQTVKLPAEYVEAHAHLTYASTAYGVQGVTVTDSHTVLDDAISAPGLYVGLTRGTDHNTLHFVAENDAEAREQFVQAMTRDRADRGLDYATTEATEATRGLTTSGPVAFVDAERQRLTEAIAYAEAQAAIWEQAAAAITELRQMHAAEREQRKAVVTTAKEHAQEVREEVTTPLLSMAVADGQALLTRTAGGVERTAHLSAGGQAPTPHRRSEPRRRTPHTRTPPDRRATTMGHRATHPDGLEAWAQTVAQKQSDEHPAVVDAEREAEGIRATAGQLARKQLAENQRLRERVYGTTGRAPGPVGHAARWRNQATVLQRTLKEIETLPTVKAEQLIRQQRAETEDRRLEAERARAECAEQVTITAYPQSPHTNPHRERGIGI